MWPFNKKETENKMYLRLKNLSYKLCDFTERIYWDETGTHRTAYTSENFNCKRVYCSDYIEYYCNIINKSGEKKFMLDAHDAGSGKLPYYELTVYTSAGVRLFSLRANKSRLDVIPVLGDDLKATDVDKTIKELENTIEEHYASLLGQTDTHNAEVKKLMEGN